MPSMKSAALSIEDCNKAAHNKHNKALDGKVRLVHGAAEACLQHREAKSESRIHKCIIKAHLLSTTCGFQSATLLCSDMACCSPRAVSFESVSSFTILSLSLSAQHSATVNTLGFYEDSNDQNALLQLSVYAAQQLSTVRVLLLLMMLLKGGANGNCLALRPLQNALQDRDLLAVRFLVVSALCVCGSMERRSDAARISPKAAALRAWASPTSPAPRVPRVADVVNEVFARVAPFVPHTRAAEVFADLSSLMSRLQTSQLHQSLVCVQRLHQPNWLYHRTCLQTDLEAQLHSARTRLARESAARRDEVDLLNGRIMAHQQSLEASERSLGETLDERSKLMRLLSECETRCQALAAQVDQLRMSLAEAGDLEGMRAKLRSDAERHAAACEAQYERALAQAVADLDAQHVRQLHTETERLQLAHRVEVEREVQQRRAQTAAAAADHLQQVQTAARKEIAEAADLIAAQQRRVEQLEAALSDARSARARADIEIDRLQASEQQLSARLDALTAAAHTAAATAQAREQAAYELNAQQREQRVRDSSHSS
eukprot:10115-Heterococcus_DN1.PRE.2